MRHARLVSRVASLALAFVLASILGFAAGAATTLGNATASAAEIFRTGDAYGAIVRAVDREIALVATDRASSRAAMVRARALAWERLRAGDPASRRAHAAYVRSTDAMFAALGANQPHLAARLEATRVAPAARALRTAVDRAYDARHLATAGALDRLASLQRAISRTAPFVAVVGFASFVALAFVLRTSRRRVDRAVARDFERLNVAAFADYLTGLGNHRAFQDEIAAAVRRAAGDGSRLALALVDIDDFKIVNDRFGHARGDRVLQNLGESLRARSALGRAYRIGGDEFAMLIAGDDARTPLAIVEHLRADLLHEKLGSTISVGLATYGPGVTVDILHERADAALYEAKRRGRDCVVAFETIAGSVSIYTAAKVNALRRIVAERALTVVFQPIVDILSSTILGYEALARFGDGENAPETSEAFDIAERIGRAYDLDEACLGAIFARAAELPSATRLFINVSPQTLDHDAFARRLEDAAASAGIAPDRVVVEITERSMERPLAVIREANRLRAAGFRLALDDVGSGNAGLALLGSLSVEFIKIDRAVVSAAASGRVGRAVYAGILAIARENGSYVIAEGIEDDAMLRFASNTRGVHGVQGYFLGRPARTPQPVGRFALAR